MSIKKKAGASAGTFVSTSCERLASTSATATNTVSPIPSESTICAVGAPGRCKLASARRSTGQWGRPSRLATQRIAAPAARNNAKAAIAPSTNHSATFRSCAVTTARDASASTRAAILPLIPGGIRRRARIPADPGKRPERESQRRQEAEQRRQGQRRRMDRKTNGDREHPGQQRRGGDRCQSPEDERDGDAEESEPQHFEEIGGENQPVRSSQTFEGRDRRGLAGDVIADRISDPHAADQEGGQPDQAQKQADAIDQSLQ